MNMPDRGAASTPQSSNRTSTIENMIGKKLGKCEITEFIGRGGMGFVFKGLHKNLNREVAIKILTQTGQDEKAVEWFLREARSIAQLSHLNIIQVHDLDYDEELATHYIVMEYVNGESLDSKVKNHSQRRLPVTEATQYMLQAAEGLEAAHKQNIIHRDVKPANIMITKDGIVKIMDFGLAKGLSGENTSRTATGLIVGTPLYMAPEQCVGNEIDGRTDIYSLGASFYFLVTGKPPFTGQNSFEILEKQITETPVPPERHTPGIPPVISKMILKMLAKHPQDRYQHCRELAEKLKETLNILTNISVPKVVCPKCGRENTNKDVFTCSTCKSANLCRSHIYPGTQSCQECAQQLQKPQVALFQASGVDKNELSKILEQIIAENREGVLGLHSRDSQLLLWITMRSITLNTQHLSLQNVKSQHPQASSHELLALLLIQALTWEPFSWDFNEEVKESIFPEDPFAIIDVYSFLQGYVSIIQIATCLSYPGGLCITSPIESAAILYQANEIKVVSPVPFPKDTVSALPSEKAEQLLERMYNSNLTLQYRNTNTLSVEGASFEYSLMEIFFEILSQFPDFNFFMNFAPYLKSSLNIDPQSRRYQLDTKDLDDIADKTMELCRSSFSQYKPLQEMGVPVSVLMLLWGSINKQKIAATVRNSMDLAKVFEEQSNLKAADALLNQALVLSPYDIKLLEQIAVGYENIKNFDRAATMWSQCGKLREDFSEISLARSCYEKAVKMAPNNPDSHIALFSLTLQQGEREEIINLGTSILPILRKAKKLDKLEEVCKKVLAVDPDSVICYKELINFYWDRNDQEEALVNYTQLAKLYHRQKRADLFSQICQKIIKIAPDRDDILFDLQRELGANLGITRTQVINMQQYRTNRAIMKAVLLSVLGIFILLTIWREWSGLRQLQIFEKQISNNQFGTIKETMFEFTKKPYLLGTHSRAATKYSAELQKYIQTMTEDYVKRKKEKINDLVSQYKHPKDSQKLKSELNDFLDSDRHNAIEPWEKTAFIEVEQIVKREKQKIEDNILAIANLENQQLYEKAMVILNRQQPSAEELSQAQNDLNQLLNRDRQVWSIKVKEALSSLRQKEEQQREAIIHNLTRQKKLFEEAKILVADGKLEQATAIYTEAFSVIKNTEKSIESQEAQKIFAEVAKTMAEANECKKMADEASQLENYDQAQEAVTHWKKLLTNPALKNTELLQQISIPIFIETSPVKGLECFYKDRKLGNSPLIYRNKIEDISQISIRQPGFQITRREEKFIIDTDYLYQVIVHVKRIPMFKPFVTDSLLYSPPVILGNYILLGSRDNYLYAIDKGSGNMLWRCTGDNEEISGEIVIESQVAYWSTLQGSVFMLHLSSRPVSERLKKIDNVKFCGGPYFYRGYVFFGGSDGCVYLVSKNPSERKYRKFQTSAPIATRPIVVNDDLFVGSGEYLYCFSWKTGSMKWDSPKKLPGTVTVEPLINNQTLFVATSPGGISAVSAATGQILWTASIPGGVKASPEVYKDTLWVGGVEKNIYLISMKDGKEIEKLPSPGFISPFFLYEKALFCVDVSFDLHVISVVDKKELWKHKLEDMVYSKPACDGEYLYIGIGNNLYTYWVYDILKSASK